jgi:hypothetical protein
MLSLLTNPRNTAAGHEFDYLLEFWIICERMRLLIKMYDATILFWVWRLCQRIIICKAWGVQNGLLHMAGAKLHSEGFPEKLHRLDGGCLHHMIVLGPGTSSQLYNNVRICPNNTMLFFITTSGLGPLLPIVVFFCVHTMCSFSSQSVNPTSSLVV